MVVKVVDVGKRTLICESIAIVDTLQEFYDPKNQELIE